MNSTDATVRPLTSEAFFADVMTGSKPALLDFWADWCGPCRSLAPELEKAAAQLGDSVDVFKVNVDDQPQLAEAFGVRSIPTVVLVRGDQALGGFVGARPAADIVQQVQGWLNAQSKAGNSSD